MDGNGSIQNKTKFILSTDQIANLRLAQKLLEVAFNKRLFIVYLNPSEPDMDDLRTINFLFDKNGDEQ